MAETLQFCTDYYFLGDFPFFRFKRRTFHVKENFYRYHTMGAV